MWKLLIVNFFPIVKLLQIYWKSAHPVYILKIVDQCLSCFLTDYIFFTKPITYQLIVCTFFDILLFILNFLPLFAITHPNVSLLLCNWIKIFTFSQLVIFNQPTKNWVLHDEIVLFTVFKGRIWLHKLLEVLIFL